LQVIKCFLKFSRSGVAEIKNFIGNTAMRMGYVVVAPDLKKLLEI
jgi:hypothetical protein